jgi:hypothetical protein
MIVHSSTYVHEYSISTTREKKLQYSVSIELSVLRRPKRIRTICCFRTIFFRVCCVRSHRSSSTAMPSSPLLLLQAAATSAALAASPVATMAVAGPMPKLGSKPAASAGGSGVFISATDPQLQLVGRFASVGSEQLFDQPGCEIRARVQLEAASTVTVLLAQRHLPPPAQATGNSKNSGFQENAFVVWVDGQRQGPGGFNATFATSRDQDDGVAYSFNITTGGAPLDAGRYTHTGCTSK